MLHITNNPEFTTMIDGKECGSLKVTDPITSLTSELKGTMVALNSFVSRLPTVDYKGVTIAYCDRMFLTTHNDEVIALVADGGKFLPRL